MQVAAPLEEVIRGRLGEVAEAEAAAGRSDPRATWPLYSTRRSTGAVRRIRLYPGHFRTWGRLGGFSAWDPVYPR